MADTTVTASVLTWLEAHPAIAAAGLPVALEHLPAEGVDAVMLSSLTGDPYVRRYKSGGFVAPYDFAVVLRANPLDTTGRLDAMGLLGDIAASIEDRTAWPSAPAGYAYDALEMRTLPAPVARYDSGAEDYQATFTLTYRKRG